MSRFFRETGKRNKEISCYTIGDTKTTLVSNKKYGGFSNDFNG